MTTDDMELVRQYAQNGSEEAFATLVNRHVNLVHSAALRQFRDPHLAEEVTHVAFIILARKAASLAPNTVLSSWLCRTAQYAASDLLKSQRRRQQREQESHMQTILHTGSSDSEQKWSQISPVLDSALSQLGEKDHAAIVLRFFEGKNLKQIGAVLGVNENTAKIRVFRATEKLRKIIFKRGVSISAVALGAAMAANSVNAAPIGLAASVTTAAVNGTSVAASTLTLIKSTLKIMAWTKAKTIVAVAGVALLAAGGATVALHSGENSNATSTKTAQASRFEFAGYATPEAAQKTLVWACHTGDIKKVVDACTKEQGERFKAKTAGTPADEIKRRLIDEGEHRANYEVTQQEKISDDEVRLHLLVQPYPGHPNVGNDVQVMRKVGNDWKYAGKWGVDIKD